MNLIVFFGLLVQYQVPIKFVSDKAKRDIYQMLKESNTIWHKFAQMLAQFMVVGESQRELGHMLEEFYAECPCHDLEYTKQVLREELSYMVDEESLLRMQFIASGTVSQTYYMVPRGHEHPVCIKVQHPRVKADINEACDAYDALKESYLFPKKFRGICDLFFESLRSQCDTGVEFTASNQFAESLKQMGMRHRRTGNELVVTPKMIAHSNRCIVMEYLPSTSVSNRTLQTTYDDISDTNLTRYFKFATMILSHMGYFTHAYHLDLHPGNLGYIYNSTTDHIQVVVYDLGQYVYMDYQAIGLDERTIFHLEKRAYTLQHNGRRREWLEPLLSTEGREYFTANSMWDTEHLPESKFFTAIGLVIIECPEYLISSRLLPVFLSVIKSTSSMALKVRTRGYIPKRLQQRTSNSIGTSAYVTPESVSLEQLFPSDIYDMGEMVFQSRDV